MGDYADDAINQGLYEMEMRASGELDDFEDEDPMDGAVIRRRRRKDWPLTPFSAFYGWERID